MSVLEDSVLKEQAPDGPVTSLRRIQAWYGALEEAAGGKVGGNPAFALYYTPGELSEFTTEDPEANPRYLVSVQVDLTEETPEYVGIDVEYCEPSDVDNLGFARYPWGRGIDHSITRRGAKGGSDADTVGTYCIDCLERWTNADGREPAVGEVADEHPDGWIITALQELGTDETVKERLQNDIKEAYTAEERAVATVRLKLDPSDLDEAPNGAPSWFSPGEVHVLNAGMKARKDYKLAQKQTSTASRGEAACMVTGDFEEVFGTVEDPLALFTVQHAEKFDELKRPEAWRSHPVSSNAALLLQSGAALLDACYTTRNGLRVYTLPYFIEMSDRRAKLLYRILDDLRDRSFDATGKHPMLVLEELVKENGTETDSEQLRFYVITLRNDSGDINVFHEIPDTTLYWPRKVATHHHEILHESTAFSKSAGFRLMENWRTIRENESVSDLLNAVVNGFYASGTLPEAAGDDGAMADDQAEWLTHSLLEGRSIPVEQLLGEYVDKIADEQEQDEENRFPHRHVKTQFAQLEALATAGLLTASPTTTYLRKPPKTMDTDYPDAEELSADGNVSQLDARRYRLKTFLDDRPSLSENSERRSAFLTGVLVGQTSQHQRTTRKQNRTVIDQYPADTITIQKLIRAWPDLIQKAHVYASDVSWAGETLFPEVIEQSTDTLTHPQDWDISIQDARFFYALGIAYGQQAKSRAYELADEYPDDQNQEAHTA